MLPHPVRGELHRTVAADGALPLAYRLADGNTGDDPTHVPTWNGLVDLLGRTDFLYVAPRRPVLYGPDVHLRPRGVGRPVRLG
jgi:hypothetical protein